MYSDDQTQLKQIGWKYDNDKGFVIERIKSTVNKVPDKLPEFITSLYNAFRWNSNEKIENLEKWDTKNVTDMSYMFNECENFAQDISMRNVEKVSKYMSFNEETHENLKPPKFNTK
ncbi:BspA family leucine-rich repeat surface protein [Mycoplasma sp. HU2014]|uniref:BspA family leucine-rich repeat surface protein n=1 Tax=Mycoplasma sp. HU2014 TaxID=1664275 RepID=UPI002E14A7D7